MEKKNTMLLTVIAVATLLVAVVGATFAYFSLTVEGNATTTKAEITTGKTGIFTASGGKSDLKLKLTATQMSQSVATSNAVNYFVDPSSGDGTPKTSVSIGEGGYPDDETVYTSIGDLKLSDASVGTKYHCQGMYTITANMKDSAGQDLQDGKEEDKNSVKVGDGALYLKTSPAQGVTISIKEDSENAPADSDGVEKINHELNSLLNSETKFWITYDFVVSSASPIQGGVKAAFKITNTQQDQNYLADKQVTITFIPSSDENTKLKCNIVNN